VSTPLRIGLSVTVTSVSLVEGFCGSGQRTERFFPGPSPPPSLDEVVEGGREEGE